MDGEDTDEDDSDIGEADRYDGTGEEGLDI